MTVFVQDSFTEASNIDLTSHAGEVGASWTIVSGGIGCWIAAGNDSVYCAEIGLGYNYASGSPESAEYDIEADVFCTDTSDGASGVIGRCSTTEQTFYLARYNFDGGDWQLFKRESGSYTLLGSYTQALTSGVLYNVKLEIRDTSKKVYVDGVERISSLNNDITLSGKAGVHARRLSDLNARLDNFTATDASAGLPVNDNGVLTDSIASALLGFESAVATDISERVIVTASPAHGIDSCKSFDSAVITTASGAVIGSGDNSFAIEQAGLVNVIASVLSGSDIAGVVDDPVIVSVMCTPSAGIETGFLTDVAALVTSYVTPISSAPGNTLLETGTLTHAGVVILPAFDSAVANMSGAMASVPAAVMIGAELAWAVDLSVLVDANGVSVASVETMSVIESAGLIQAVGLSIHADETLSLTDTAELTRVISNILTSAEGQGRNIKAIFGVPVLMPALSGNPVLKNKLQGTPILTRR